MTEDTEIRPALTPEEWKREAMWRTKHMVEAQDFPKPALGIRLNAGGGNPDRALGEFADGVRHGLAALALHGQPFGFTWVHHEAVHLATCTEAARLNPKLMAALEEVRDRIAALLPPR